MNVTWSPGLLEEQTQALGASVGDSLGQNVGGRLLRGEASSLDVTCQVVAGVFLLVRSGPAVVAAEGHCVVEVGPDVLRQATGASAAIQQVYRPGAGRPLGKRKLTDSTAASE